LDHFLLLGAFGQLGFEICEQLLNKGYQVTHLNISDEYEDPAIIEKKTLFIGRNDNFKRMEDLEICHHVPIIFPIYDWYFFHEEQWKIMQTKLSLFLSRLKRLAPSTYLIFIQSKIEGVISSKINTFFEKIEKDFQNVLSINIPILYGKWLSVTSPLFQLLMGENVERTGEAIFIGDAVKVIIDLISYEEQGVYSIKNKNKNRYRECLYEITGIKSQIVNEKRKIDKYDGKVVLVEESNNGIEILDDKKNMIYLSKI
jgi:hypothetical protein